VWLVAAPRAAGLAAAPLVVQTGLAHPGRRGAGMPAVLGEVALARVALP